MTTRNDILSKLNDEQKIPCQNYHGPSFIIAGPGSGKTTVLVARTQIMLLDNVNPSNILLFTFTNKAAREIKERIGRAVGSDLASKITMGTYHSFCCRILRQYADHLSYSKKFSIFDSEDSKKVLKKITEGTDIDHMLLQSYVSNKKRNLIRPSIAMQNSLDDLAAYYGKYQDELFKQNAMDFDDLIFNTIMLLENNNDILNQINNRYKYIMADESHDSSRSDLRLIELLAGKDRNICFILDDNQSIYSFRGADIQAVLNIRNIFEDLKLYYLNQNYRCSKNIVEASKALISKNKIQLEKNIFTENHDGDKIFVLEESNQTYESMRVAKTIELLKRKYGYNYRDIAILYRMGNMSRSLEEVFLKMKIPYNILSGINFYSRKEIKDILAFIRFLVNPYDFESFSRIINVPKRGIGEKTIEKILDYARYSQENSLDLLEVCRRIELKGKMKKSLENFVAIIDSLLEKMNDNTPAELIQNIIKFTDYYDHLKEISDKDEYDDRLSNIIELVDLSHTFITLEEFLENTSLDSKSNEDPDDKVQMLTQHMSKGLEWKVVFIVGANDGTNPHFRSLDSEKSIEEERRLFYVAMTRAKEKLFITRPMRIMNRGMYTSAAPSRFLKDIDKKYLYINNNK